MNIKRTVSKDLSAKEEAMFDSMEGTSEEIQAAKDVYVELRSAKVGPGLFEYLDVGNTVPYTPDMMA